MNQQEQDYLILFLFFLVFAILQFIIYRQEIKKVKLWREIEAIQNEDLLSKIQFWKTRCEEFNLDKAILHERNLRKRFETLYHKACDKIDKLEDKRKNNGTKHKQRTSKGNQIKN